MISVYSISYTDGVITLQGRDKKGKRSIDIPYTPYVYFESKQDLPFDGTEERVLKGKKMLLYKHRTTEQVGYEADVSPIHKFVREYNVQPFKAYTDDLKPCKGYIAPRVLAVDIEVYAPHFELNSKKYPCISIGYYSKDRQEVHTWKPAKNAVVHKSEADMLVACQSIFEEYDIITGYNSDGFDFPYIVDRCITLDVEHKFVNRINYPGTLHVDLYKAVKYLLGGSWKLDKYSLDNVAHYVLNERKHDVDLSGLAPAFDKGTFDDYVSYNLQDAKITYELYKNFEQNLLTFCDLLRYNMHTLVRGSFSKLVEAYLYIHAEEHNQLFPAIPQVDPKGPVPGALVREPKPGVYDNIAVFDFLSLYPTIIISHNIGYESLGSGKAVPGEKMKFNDTFSFIPTILGGIIEQRVQLKAEQKRDPTKNRASLIYALKLLANSFYGYMGFVRSRWHSRECARAITAYARYYITKVIKAAEKQGFDVVYSDTDSIMIVLGDTDKKVAEDFVDSVNEGLPGIMEIECEGYFSKGLFVESRQGGGAKKKYALKDDGYKIVGFEYVRRNYCRFVRDVQYDVITSILDGNTNVKEIVDAAVEKLQQGKVDLKDLVITARLTKKPSEYKVLSPHVAVYQKNVERGIKIRIGDNIEYVVGPGKGKISGRVEDVRFATTYDKTYYIDKQLMQIMTPLLKLVESKQQGLFSYM